ncbi:maleylpyruvate isomerase family mycothiol-dependent enzyme [Nocardioides aurantiacus]|uniref:maleylpyruvate isomerase family mycothiol-dependent enzyme n=1 Tax=Nocardioides aurantiacus TaxID=86796 RepID=UPI00403FB1D9
MSDVQPGVATTYAGLADLLEADPDAWDAPSLCADWQVRHVVAHVTMPVRLTPELFGAEMAAARGDFGVLSDTVAARDAALPVAVLLDQLRSAELHAWTPPGGGAPGALSHAVIHSLDVTLALGRPSLAPPDALAAVRERVADGDLFGVDPDGVREQDAPDEAVAMLAGRTLPDGRALPRR